LKLRQKKLIELDNTHIDKIINKQTQTHFTKPLALFKFLVDEFGREVVAASGQKITEEIISELVNNVKDKTGSNDFCLSGGLFLNVKVNQRLFKEGKNIFPFPAAGDSGLCVGAALEAYYQITGKRINKKIESVYLGPEYNEEEIEKVLTNRNITFEKYDDAIFDIVAKLLAHGKIIGWFQGKMEFGPRALGSRSILADPRDGKMKDIVNEKIKHREPFRPFTPSLLYESRKEYFGTNIESPFMILAFDVPEEIQKEIPAVVHVDGTTRPQTVRKEVNEKYWNLIKAFEDITSIPVVLNTSFNVRGEPIVCTPSDALNCFFNTDLDYLVMGNFLIKK